MGSSCKFCIGGMNVNCVGIDVSNGKSMIAVMRPLGEMVISPFVVGHTDVELCELPRLLRKLDGDTRVVMEATGNYHMASSPSIGVCAPWPEVLVKTTSDPANGQEVVTMMDEKKPLSATPWKK